MPKPQKINLYYDRLVLAFVLGGFTGFLIAYKLKQNYVVWLTFCWALAFGIETITRVSKETKKAQPPEKIKLPPRGIPTPKLSKAPKLPKKFFK